MGREENGATQQSQSVCTKLTTLLLTTLVFAVLTTAHARIVFEVPAITEEALRSTINQAINYSLAIQASSIPPLPPPSDVVVTLAPSLRKNTALQQTVTLQQPLNITQPMQINLLDVDLDTYADAFGLKYGIDLDFVLLLQLECSFDPSLPNGSLAPAFNILAPNVTIANVFIRNCPLAVASAQPQTRLYYSKYQSCQTTASISGENATLRFMTWAASDNAVTFPRHLTFTNMFLESIPEVHFQAADMLLKVVAAPNSAIFLYGERSHVDDGKIGDVSSFDQLLPTYITLTSTCSECSVQNTRFYGAKDAVLVADGNDVTIHSSLFYFPYPDDGNLISVAAIAANGDRIQIHDNAFERYGIGIRLAGSFATMRRNALGHPWPSFACLQGIALVDDTHNSTIGGDALDDGNAFYTSATAISGSASHLAPHLRVMHNTFGVSHPLHSQWNMYKAAIPSRAISLFSCRFAQVKHNIIALNQGIFAVHIVEGHDVEIHSNVVVPWVEDEHYLRALPDLLEAIKTDKPCTEEPPLLATFPSITEAQIQRLPSSGCIRVSGTYYSVCGNVVRYCVTAIAASGLGGHLARNTILARNHGLQTVHGITVLEALSHTIHHNAIIGYVDVALYAFGQTVNSIWYGNTVGCLQPACESHFNLTSAQIGIYLKNAVDTTIGVQEKAPNVVLGAVKGIVVERASGTTTITNTLIGITPQGLYGHTFEDQDTGIYVYQSQDIQIGTASYATFNSQSSTMQQHVLAVANVVFGYKTAVHIDFTREATIVGNVFGASKNGVPIFPVRASTTALKITNSRSIDVGFPTEWSKDPLYFTSPLLRFQLAQPQLPGFVPTPITMPANFTLRDYTQHDIPSIDEVSGGLPSPFYGNVIVASTAIQANASQYVSINANIVNLLRAHAGAPFTEKATCKEAIYATDTSDVIIHANLLFSSLPLGEYSVVSVAMKSSLLLERNVILSHGGGATPLRTSRGIHIVSCTENSVAQLARQGRGNWIDMVDEAIVVQSCETPKELDISSNFIGLDMTQSVQTGVYAIATTNAKVTNTYVSATTYGVTVTGETIVVKNNYFNAFPSTTIDASTKLQQNPIVHPPTRIRTEGVFATAAIHVHYATSCTVESNVVLDGAVGIRLGRDGVLSSASLNDTRVVGNFLDNQIVGLDISDFNTVLIGNYVQSLNSSLIVRAQNLSAFGNMFISDSSAHFAVWLQSTSAGVVLGGSKYLYPHTIELLQRTSLLDPFPSLLIHMNSTASAGNVIAGGHVALGIEGQGHVIQSNYMGFEVQPSARLVTAAFDTFDESLRKCPFNNCFRLRTANASFQTSSASHDVIVGPAISEVISTFDALQDPSTELKSCLDGICSSLVPELDCVTTVTSCFVYSWYQWDTFAHSNLVAIDAILHSALLGYGSKPQSVFAFANPALWYRRNIPQVDIAGTKPQPSILISTTFTDTAVELLLDPTLLFPTNPTDCSVTVLVTVALSMTTECSRFVQFTQTADQIPSTLVLPAVFQKSPATCATGLQDTLPRTTFSLPLAPLREMDPNSTSVSILVSFHNPENTVLRECLVLPVPTTTTTPKLTTTATKATLPPSGSTKRTHPAVIALAVLFVVVLAAGVLWLVASRRNRKVDSIAMASQSAINQSQFQAIVQLAQLHFESRYNIRLGGAADNLNIIEPDKIQPGVSVGTGNFAVVRKGIMQPNDQIVALKTATSIRSTDELTTFVMELLLMQHFRHEHIVRVIGACMLRDQPTIVMEYASLGNVRDHLRNTPHSNLSDRYAWLFQIASAMEHISSFNIVHRDLAARNVLLHRPRWVKLADFGLSRMVASQSTPYISQAITAIPYRWMAPESLISNEYSTASDVWSFGILVWEIFNKGMTPFADLSLPQLLNFYDSQQVLTSNIPDNLLQLVQGCFTLNSLNRPSFCAVRQQLRDIQNMVEESQV
eukprot:m.304292 g.304292  ORF g.304292 m.304292 type:complete len:1936 (-) comp15897_c0_seq2:324-6131(-)